MPEEPPIAIVSKRELRNRFNRGGFLERLESGALTAVVIASSHPSPPLAGEPFCTHSQLVEYTTAQGAAVAIVHQYLRPNGTLGLSGLPDPKMIRDRGLTYLPEET
jgi:hypothetical protein